MFEQQLLSIVNKNEVRAALIEIKKNIKGNEAALKATPGYAKELWKELLYDEDPKVRKNVALIMGVLKEDGFRESLFDRYMSEDTLFVKSAYLEALMNFDYQIFADKLTEELIGKTLVAITNLPPRKMMGRESCGMLISAVHTEKGEEKLNLLMVSDAIPAGAKLC